MAEARDPSTSEHMFRVGLYAGMLAEAIEMPNYVLVYHAAEAHDIGKSGIADGVLLKPGKYDEEEYALIKTHTRRGYHFLTGSNEPMIELAANIALTHHERWDGRGYPSGLEEEDIPLEGRVTAIADAWDAMSNDRVYRKALPTEEAQQVLRDGAGSQFDPNLVEVWLSVVNAMKEEFNA